MIQALCEIAIIISTMWGMVINGAPWWAVGVAFNLLCFIEVVSIRLEGAK